MSAALSFSNTRHGGQSVLAFSHRQLIIIISFRAVFIIRGKFPSTWTTTTLSTTIWPPLIWHSSTIDPFFRDAERPSWWWRFTPSRWRRFGPCRIDGQFGKSITRQRIDCRSKIFGSFAFEDGSRSEKIRIGSWRCSYSSRLFSFKKQVSWTVTFSIQIIDRRLSIRPDLKNGYNQLNRIILSAATLMIRFLIELVCPLISSVVVVVHCWWNDESIDWINVYVRLNWSADEARSVLPLLSLKNTELKNSCPESITCPSASSIKYRPIDGSCHNLAHPDWGKANTPFQRALPNAYADGSSTCSNKQ